MAVRTKIRRGKYATWSWILLIACPSPKFSPAGSGWSAGS